MLTCMPVTESLEDQSVSSFSSSLISYKTVLIVNWDILPHTFTQVFFSLRHLNISWRFPPHLVRQPVQFCFSCEERVGVSYGEIPQVAVVHFFPNLFHDCSKHLAAWSQARSWAVRQGVRVIRLGFVSVGSAQPVISQSSCWVCGWYVVLNLKSVQTEDAAKQSLFRLRRSGAVMKCRHVRCCCLLGCRLLAGESLAFLIP